MATRRQDHPVGMMCFGGSGRAIGTEAVEDYRTTLRRLALREDRYIESLLADDDVNATVSKIAPSSHALVRIGALIAMNATPPSYMSAVAAADEAGVTREELVGTLIAVLPVVGVARVVSAAPNLGLALGYDVGEALETLEHATRPG